MGESLLLGAPNTQKIDTHTFFAVEFFKLGLEQALDIAYDVQTLNDLKEHLSNDLKGVREHLREILGPYLGL